MKHEFSPYFSKNPQTSNFIKIRPAVAEQFHEDERTDMTELIVAFRNFANTPKIGKHVIMTENLFTNIK
jgi:hypothetical protein